VSYKIRAYRTAELVLKGNHAFDGGDPNVASLYSLYVWIIMGGERPIVVDTGPKKIDEITSGIAGMCIEPLIQREGEDIRAIMARAHIDPTDVGHVFLTHLHYNHITNISLFPNAKIVVDKIGYDEALRRLETGKCWAPDEIVFAMRDEWQNRMMFVRDNEVLPGIKAFHLGGHTPCSMGISVRTEAGRAVITGDVVSLYENIEKDIAVGIYEDRAELMAAMRRIRTEADIILPSHDPMVLQRHRGGMVG